MSATHLNETTGWTPMIDALVERHGVITAAVFGVVWRHCQMKDGVCKASLARLAQRLGFSRRTVIRHLAILVAEGYLRDLSPGVKHAVHVYVDTGKAAYIKFALPDPEAEPVETDQAAEAVESSLGAAPLLEAADPGADQGNQPDPEWGQLHSSAEAGEPGCSSGGGVIEGHSRVAESHSPAVDKSANCENGVTESIPNSPESHTGGDAESQVGVTEGQLNKTLLRDSLRDLVKKRVPAAEIWTLVRQRLREQAGQERSRGAGREAILDRCLAQEWEGEVLTLLTSSPASCYWLGNNLREQIEAVLVELSGSPRARVVFRVDSQPSTAGQQPAGSLPSDGSPIDGILPAYRKI